MSLTSFLKDPDNQEVRDYLKTKFARPKFTLKSEIKAPQLTNNYGVVGNAFDYLFRAKLKHINPAKEFIESGWVASMGFKTLHNIYKKKEASQKLAMIEKKFESSKQDFEEYIKTGEPTDSLISNAIFFGKLDLIFRAAYIDSDYENCSSLDIADIKAMLRLIEPNQFQVKERCWLNPAFVASHIVGGADGDFIIDDTLIDIKTTKHLELSRSDLNQIICYYILSLMGGVSSKEKDIPLKNIGIYYARFGLLYTFPISEIASEEVVHNFKNWWFAYCREDGITYDNLNLLLSIVGVKS